MFLVDIYIYIIYIYIFWNFILFDILSGSFWHILWHSITPSIWHLFWHSMWHSTVCDILHSQLRSRSAHWDLALAVEVRQCPLSSGARGWGPAVVPTELWRSQLRPGSAHSRLRPGSANWALALAVSVPHWDLALAVEGEVGGGRWRKRRRMDEEVGEGGRRHADLIKPRRLTWPGAEQPSAFLPNKRVRNVHLSFHQWQLRCNC